MVKHLYYCDVCGCQVPAEDRTYLQLRDGHGVTDTLTLASRPDPTDEALLCLKCCGKIQEILRVLPCTEECAEETPKEVSWDLKDIHGGY